MFQKTLLGCRFALIVALLGISTNGASGNGCIQAPDGMVAWWTGDTTTEDNVNGNDGTWVGTAGYAHGKVADAFSFANGGPGVIEGVKVPPSASLDVKSAITIDAWVNPASYGPIVEYRSNTWLPFGPHLWVLGSDARDIYINLVDINQNEHQIQVAKVLEPGIFQHIAVTYDKATGLAKVYLNGIKIREESPGAFDLETGKGLNIGLRDTGTYPDDGSLKGLIDEVEIFNRALSDSEILGIYNAGGSGKCKPKAFAIFTPSAELKFGPETQDDTLKISSYLKLSSDSNGINPVVEEVAIQFGNFSKTIPAGSFLAEGRGFKYWNPGDKFGVWIKPAYRHGHDAAETSANWPRQQGAYKVDAVGTAMDMSGMVIPPQVKLSIGDDRGKATLDMGKGWFGTGGNLNK